MMQWIVDRIEQTIVVCEDEQGQMHHLPLSQLPSPLHEGDVLLEQDGVFSRDETATAQRAQHIRAKMRRLWK